jgi:hypothetical protein
LWWRPVQVRRAGAGVGIGVGIGIGIILATSLATSPGCDGCPPPVTLKTLDLKPISQPTGTSGKAGSMGYCLSAGNAPPSSFSAGPGQVMVGFDNFFRAGAEPFPCDDIRATVFRGGVRFDLSVFDNPTTATLSFDTARSITRVNGQALGTVPGQSLATTLGVATQAFTSTMPETNEAALPAGSTISVTVTGQVGDWVKNGVPNFGFVIGGPTGLVNASNPPKNNDAKISWYQNFNLRVVYNPKLNPRAPQ